MKTILQRNTPVVRIRRWFKKNQEWAGFIVALIFFAGMGLAGNWDAQDEEKQGQAVAGFWTADSERHFSGEE